MEVIKITIINGILFYNIKYSLNGIIKVLKEKGAYYKCNVCGKKFVKKEDEICEGCKYLVGLELPEKKDSELSENRKS